MGLSENRLSEHHHFPFFQWLFGRYTHFQTHQYWLTQILGHINYPPVIKHSNVTFPLNVRYSIAKLHYRSVTKTEILISRWCGEEEERAVQSAWLVLIEEFNRLVI